MQPTDTVLRRSLTKALGLTLIACLEPKRVLTYYSFLGSFSLSCLCKQQTFNPVWNLWLCRNCPHTNASWAVELCPPPLSLILWGAAEADWSRISSEGSIPQTTSLSIACLESQGLHCFLTPLFSAHLNLYWIDQVSFISHHESVSRLHTILDWR